MTETRISKYGGEFVSDALEQLYLAANWPQTAVHLRIVAGIIIMGLISSYYLYYLFFGVGFQFQVLFLLQMPVILAMSGLFALTYSDSFAPAARLLSLLAQLLYSVSQLTEYHFLLQNHSHSEVGMPFIVVLILVYYSFMPNRTWIIVLSSSFASLIFLCYYTLSPAIPIESTYMLFIELFAVNAFGYLFLINWNRLRRQEFSHRKELENEMVKRKLAEKTAQKASASKTRFLAAASHDLRQPLQAQRLFAEAIRNQSRGTELSELSEQMLDSQRSMQSMLDTLLDISRLDAGIVKAIDVDVSIKDLFFHLDRDFTPLAEEKGIRLHVHWLTADMATRCDRGLVESILRNLLGNAIRYTEQGTVMLVARRRGTNLRLEVRDSGIGIAQEKQAEIFEEFRQLANPDRDRAKGLGLGLSIVQRLCLLLDYPLSL